MVVLKKYKRAPVTNDSWRTLKEDAALVGYMPSCQLKRLNKKSRGIFQGHKYKAALVGGDSR